jgi:hypothetical protein
MNGVKKFRPSGHKSIRLARTAVAGLLDILLYLSEIPNRNLDSMIVESVGQLDCDKPTLFYAHFSNSGKLDKNDLALLDAAMVSDWQVCLISNSPLKPEPNDFHSTMWRRNRGRDLAGFRDAIRVHANLSNEVLFINSSLLWTVESWNNLLSLFRESREDADVLGVVDSFQKRWHIQSFAYYFKPSFMQSGQAFDVWRKCYNWRSKRLVVKYGEIGFVNNAMTYGIVVRPVILYQTLLRKLFDESAIGNSSLFEETLLKKVRKGIHLNPSTHLQRFLSSYIAAKKRNVSMDSNPTIHHSIPDE